MTSFHTGADYFKQITASEADRGVRAAFQDLVLKIAPPHAALFDFGAGPGIDARFFAERGFKIRAYDVDPKMCEFFAANCRDLIDSGRVVLERGGYREFLTGKSSDSEGPVDLIISNFAPLNQIDDLRELFARFHELTGPNGKVLASVLNPIFLDDMKYPWWWRRAPRLWRDGHFSLSGALAPPHTRRRLGEYSRLSLPHFRLTRVYRGVAPHREGPVDGVDVSRGGRLAWLHVVACRFMVLLFEKSG
jgi:SAM-dependent methyltransferase